MDFYQETGPSGAVCPVGMDERLASSVSQSDLCLTDRDLQTEVMISCERTFNHFMKNESLYLGVQTLFSPSFVVSRVVVSLLVKKPQSPKHHVQPSSGKAPRCPTPQEERMQEIEKHRSATEISKGLSSWHL